MEFPDQPDLEGVAHDLHVRRQAICGGGGGLQYYRFRHFPVGQPPGLSRPLHVPAKVAPKLTGPVRKPQALYPGKLLGVAGRQNRAAA
jgi:hypothetical protein